MGNVICGTGMAAPETAFRFSTMNALYLKMSKSRISTKIPPPTANFARGVSRNLPINMPMNQLKNELNSKSKIQSGSPQA